jgi:hypothetical protein
MKESTDQTPAPEEWEAHFRAWGQRALPEAAPFLYSRLHSHLLQAEEASEWLPWWLRRPVYAYAGVALLVLLNVGMVKELTHDEANRNDTIAVAAALQSDYLPDAYVLTYE